MDNNKLRKLKTRTEKGGYDGRKAFEEVLDEIEPLIKSTYNHLVKDPPSKSDKKDGLQALKLIAFETFKKWDPDLGHFKNFFSKPSKGIYDELRKYKNTISKKSHSNTSFKEKEFEQLFTIEALCQSINADDYGLSFKSSDNSVDRLNELLEVTNFYDVLCKKKEKIDHTSEIKSLINKTREYRNERFAKLGNTKKENIKRLNRLLLEKVYPLETPESKKTSYRVISASGTSGKNPNASDKDPDSIFGDYDQKKYFQENKSNAESESKKEDRIRNMRRTLQELNAEEVAVFRLRYYSGDKVMTFKEIAEKLGENENAVKARHRRGLPKLKQKLKKRGS